MTSPYFAIARNHVVLLAIFTLSACQTSPPTTLQAPAPLTITSEGSVLTHISQSNFADTNARLKTAIESRGLTLFAIVDHAAGAAKVGQTLAPNTLYIFGNPQAGTPLMLANPALGLELPLKANIREENGQVSITVSDIRTITANAGVTEPAQVINNIVGALDAIASEAAGG